MNELSNRHFGFHGEPKTPKLKRKYYLGVSLPIDPETIDDDHAHVEAVVGKLCSGYGEGMGKRDIEWKCKKKRALAAYNLLHQQGFEAYLLIIGDSVQLNGGKTRWNGPALKAQFKSFEALLLPSELAALADEEAAGQVAK